MAPKNDSFHYELYREPLNVQMARPGHKLPAVTLYAEPDQVQTAFEKMTKAWICVECGREFDLLGSMGQLECYQHPGKLQEDGRWTCCGKYQNPVRWSQNWPVQRMFDSCGADRSKPPYQPVPSVRGCQKCDHNTSRAAFTHRDAMPITDLSALLPVINKEFPFYLRNGFDEGVLRRCAKRKIVVPSNAVKVVYMDNSGKRQTYTPETDGPVPEGIEISAQDEDGDAIEYWH